MRHFLIFVLFSTTIQAGSFHDFVKAKTELSETEQAIQYINSFLAKEEVDVTEGYEIFVDISEYLVLHTENASFISLAQLIKQKGEGRKILQELSELDEYFKALLEGHELLTRMKDFLSALIPFLAKEEFILADCINLDSSFRKKFIEAFQTWRFVRTRDEEKKQELVSELYKSTYMRYVRAFVDEIEDLTSSQLDKSHIGLFKDRLIRICKLLVEELTLIENYVSHELKIKMLIRQLRGYIRYREGETQKPAQDIKYTLREISELLEQVLKDIPNQKISLP